MTSWYEEIKTVGQFHALSDAEIRSIPKGYLAGNFGPAYPKLGAKVAKLRNGNDRRAHGLAVLDVIRGMNAKMHQTVVSERAAECPSRTSHNNGADILKAIAQQNRAAACAQGPSIDARPEAEKYHEAMAAKRAALAAPIAPPVAPPVPAPAPIKVKAPRKPRKVAKPAVVDAPPIAPAPAPVLYDPLYAAHMTAMQVLAGMF